MGIHDAACKQSIPAIKMRLFHTCMKSRKIKLASLPSACKDIPEKGALSSYYLNFLPRGKRPGKIPVLYLKRHDSGVTLVKKGLDQGD